MRTIQLTDEMVERLERFYGMPEYLEDEEHKTAYEIVSELAEQLHTKNYTLK